MGLFDRFNPPADPRGRTYEGQRVDASDDEQALARYRYMLRTAPPEAIEQAHAEAFAKLTPAQRQILLEQFRSKVPEKEIAYATENPQALARLATRAEVRQPGTLERLFGRVPAMGPGLGGMMAGSLLGSMAGTVLGTMIAQNFLAGHEWSHGAFGAAEPAHDTGFAQDTGADAADIGGLDDIGGDFDAGSFDV